MMFTQWIDRDHSMLGRQSVIGRRGCRAGILVLVALGMFMGCSTEITTRGNAPNPKKLSQIKVGEHNRSQVARLLGTPSNAAIFNDRIWYYVSRKTRSVAFYKPEVLESQVIAIHFDTSGKVKEIRRYTQKDGRDITPVARATPTPGREMGLMEQLLGNIGRFEVEDQRTTNRPP
ncbi:MAG: outer membrane protein assembly factor BamE [Alphaproteobacteria bacterium]